LEFKSSVKSLFIVK